MSHNPTVINQFDTTMDEVLFWIILILILGLLFSTILVLFKFEFKIKSFIIISIIGLLYIFCTIPLLKNIHTDGLSDQTLKNILLITTSMALLSIFEGILSYIFISLMFKILTAFISYDIKNTLLYVYTLVIVLLLFTIVPVIFISAIDNFTTFT